MNKCKKQTTFAVIVTDNRVFVGRNGCCNSIENCPREGMGTGVGYELCLNVCGQVSHAEVDAINQAGDLAKGGTMYLHGHTYACDNCIEAASKAGVREIVLVESSKSLWKKKGSEAWAKTIKQSNLT